MAGVYDDLNVRPTTSGMSLKNSAPPKVLYVMRHGRTAIDDTHRSDGWIDLPLSDEGRQQVVEAMATYLTGVPIKCIYTPGLRRTDETAYILRSGINPQPDIEVREDGRTWKLGDISGRPKKETKPEVKRLLTQARSERPPGGESYNEFTGRFDPFFQEMQEDTLNGEGPNLLVLSGSNCRRIGELLFQDRTMTDLDEAGIFMLYPQEDGSWGMYMLEGSNTAGDEIS